LTLKNVPKLDVPKWKRTELDRVQKTIDCVQKTVCTKMDLDNYRIGPRTEMDHLY